MTEREKLNWSLRSLPKHFPKGFGSRLLWQYGGSMIAAISGFAYTILLARNLGTSRFGLIALALAVSTLCMQPFHANMRDFAVRFVSLGLKHNDPNALVCATGLSLAANIALMSLFYLVFDAFADPLGTLLGQPEQFSVTLAIAACTPIFQVGLTDALTGVLRALNHVRDLALILSLTAIVRLTWTWLGLTFFAAGVNEILFISAASLAIGAAALLLITIVRLRNETTVDFGKININQFIERYRPAPFIRRNYFINLLSLPTKELDTFVLGFFATLDGIGVYRVAKNFVNVIWVIADPLHLVIYPELARLWNDSARSEIRRFLKNIFAGLLVMTLVVLLGSYLAVPAVIEKLVGPEFEDSAKYFLIMITSVMIWLPLIWVHPLFLASGHNELSLRAAIIHSFVSTGIYISFGYLAATTGIAIAYSLSLALISLLQVYFLMQARLLAR